MGKAAILLGAGLVSLFLGMRLTQQYLRGQGYADKDFDQVAGKNVVPGWVSLVVILGWMLVAVAGVLFLIALF